jgi:hypothetical protein
MQGAAEKKGKEFKKNLFRKTKKGGISPALSLTDYRLLITDY